MVQTINDLEARIYGIKIKDDRLFITVTDNGNGIPQRTWAKYFSRFLLRNRRDREPDWD